MRRLAGLVLGLGLATMLSAGTAQASTIVLNYSNVTNAVMNFQTGGGFSFTDGNGGYDFGITSESGISGFTGSFGNISGNFLISNVQTLAPGYQTGTVTTTSPTATFSIYDSANNALTWTINWISIYTLGSTGALNSGLSINLTNATYSGANAAFLTMAAAGNPAANLTFNFASPYSLSQLVQFGGPTGGTNSYSGSLVVSPVPEPASMMLLGTGLLGIAALARRRSRGRQAQN